MSKSKATARSVMSVRMRTTLFILIPLFIVAAATAYWAYNKTKDRAEIRFDDSLWATASAISHDIALSGGDALSVRTRDLINDTSGDRAYYHVYAPDGVFVTGYATPPVSTLHANSDRRIFFDAKYLGSDVRVLRLREAMQIDGLQGDFNFTVWQNTTARDAFVVEQANQTFTVIAILTSSVAFIVWMGISFGLRPLLNLQNAIAIRSSSDLTQIKRAIPFEVNGVVETLNSLLTQVDQSMQEKNDFISNAAHQLRNPVAGVMAMAEAVRSAPDGVSAKSRASDLYEAAQHMSDLANKLVSFERANRTGDTGTHETVDLSLVADSITKSMATDVQDKVQVRFKSSESPVRVTCDPVMLKEAITNLIDNALTHGGNDLTEVVVSVSKAGQYAQLKVYDDGIGISVDQQATALERFGQVNRGHGSGLGLSIVQSVVNSLGGRFSFEDHGRGLCAVMALPQATPAN